MRLWKKRPRSEDISHKDFSVLNEMPPTLVYISPGNQRISKKFAVKNAEHLVKNHKTSEQSEIEINSENKNFKNNIVRSFRDYKIEDSKIFEVNTIKSTTSSNKDCKYYLSPISLDWSPVKDVMRICRSSSVPFQNKKSNKIISPEDQTCSHQSLKSQTSFSDKIKIFFRSRSTSRPSKTIQYSMSDKPPSESTMNENKFFRTSRSRFKDSSCCKSIYQPTGIPEKLFSHNQKQMTKTDLQSEDIRNNFPLSMTRNKIKENTKVKANDQEEKISVNVEEDKRQVKTQLPAFGTPHFCEKNDIHLNKNNVKLNKNSVLNIHKSSSVSGPQIVNKIDLQVSYKPLQAKVAPKSERKIAYINESSKILTDRFDRLSASDCKPKKEELLPNKVTASLLKRTEKRSQINDHIKDKNDDEDKDYVTLGNVNLPLPINNNFMAQSLYIPVVHEFSNANYQCGINKSNLLNRQNKNNNPTNICQKHQCRFVSPGIDIRRRPISCLAIVNNDLKLASASILGMCDNHSKSPYLTQYSKLYSLKQNSQSLFQKCDTSIAGINLIMRSQPSDQSILKSAAPDNRQNGTSSIDSGVVEDVNVLHSENVQKDHKHCPDKAS